MEQQETGAPLRKRTRVTTPQAVRSELTLESITLQSAMREIRELREEPNERVLAMWRSGALPIRMPIFNGKQGRIKKNSFYYKGNLDGDNCLFKIDTGSDVLVVNEKVIIGPKQRYEINNCCLKYPTGETISVSYKVIVEIELGKHLLEVPIIIEEKVPSFLKTFFEENSKNLISSQKDIFTDFLIEFQDVFSENLVAGNCEVLEHAINVENSKSIKQAPRRIPLHLREEVDRIIQDMKSQGVIEES
ncbi:retroviral aspartyl protease family protein [Lasius niger]|uniref:Retroviral aspartyl protease family protein n=1 Tax=Lasius niger TaxID=67767 RepID=A0A0J7K1R8_LASNI|nr:retroviral aspartyl protease family protein [Lasius niger]